MPEPRLVNQKYTDSDNEMTVIVKHHCRVAFLIPLYLTFTPPSFPLYEPIYTNLGRR